jgi:hypothetical protein
MQLYPMESENIQDFPWGGISYTEPFFQTFLIQTVSFIVLCSIAVSICQRMLFGTYSAKHDSTEGKLADRMFVTR